MGAPQMILVVFYALGLGIAVSQHGKPKEGKTNAVYSLIGTAIVVGLLIWGGFFR